MTSKKSILYIVFILFSIQNYAQQTPHYTQYLYNMQVFNPAIVGARADMSISLLSRSQWRRVEGAPKTQTLSLNARTKRGIAIGGTVINDQIGLAKSTSIYADVSYTLITSEKSRLAFGLKGGTNFFSNNLASAITPDNDPYQSTAGNYPNIGFGAFFYNKTYFVGLSIPYLLKSSEFILEPSGVTELTDSNNYFFTGGIRYHINDDYMIKPSTLIKYTAGLPISIDFNANILYKKIVEGGLSYRYNDAITAMLAIIIDERFRLGYSYDHKITEFGTNLNAHEIVLHIDLKLKRSGRWLLNDSCYF